MAPSPSYSFSSSCATPILLLKTKSTPHDGYEEFFSAHGYNPAFVPVLEHHFNQSNLRIVKDLFTSGSLSPGPRRKYGGLIFTSQRAVEGFARLVTAEVDASIAKDASRSLILYTVGPATSRSLTTLRDTHLPHASIYGSDAGDGQRLALAILEHYNALYEDDAAAAKPPLLFLVGEQRRDIIPRTLMAESLPSAKRIQVDELVVYETGVMESFEGDFRAAVRAGREYLAVAGADGDGDAGESEGAGQRVIWVVVFSPTGCDAMLRVLGLLSTSTDTPVGGAGGASALVDGIASGAERRVFVATIGPTTRDHLVKNYRFEPDVCAEKPSPEGVGAGIEAFMRRRREESSNRT